jgi:hypothetical protein
MYATLSIFYCYYTPYGYVYRLCDQFLVDASMSIAHLPQKSTCYLNLPVPLKPVSFARLRSAKRHVTKISRDRIDPRKKVVSEQFSIRAWTTAIRSGCVGEQAHRQLPAVLARVAIRDGDHTRSRLVQETDRYPVCGPDEANND